MSHTIRSRTYMQVAARERSHRAQVAQVALALLVLLSIVFWNQIHRPAELSATQETEQQTQLQVEDAGEYVGEYDLSNGL